MSDDTVKDIARNLAATGDWHLLGVLADALDDADREPEIAALLRFLARAHPADPLRDIHARRALALAEGGAKADAVAALEAFARHAGKDYENVMADAAVVLAGDGPVVDPGYSRAWDLCTVWSMHGYGFWDAYAAVMGRKPDGDDDTLYECPC